MKRADRVETIVSIQVLRAVAALAVVVSHTAFDLNRFGGASGALPHFNLGDAGVDLFFVISGFVMLYASEPLYGSAGGALTFLTHRIIRIVPLYWLATTFYVAIALTVASFAKSYRPEMIATSYLFIPLPRPDGIMQPIVGQGWTLNYEMFFYAIFTLAVLAPRRIAAALACCTLIAAALLGRLMPLPPTLAFWTEPIVLEFALGILLGLAYRGGRALPQPLACILMIGGFALIAIGEPAARAQTWRFLFWGVPAALVVAGATLGRFSLRGPAWRPLAILGDASYALYLFHPVPIRAILLLARRVGIEASHILWLYVPVAIAAAVLVATTIHYVFERPATTALRRAAAFARSGRSRAAGEAEAMPAEWRSGEPTTAT